MTPQARRERAELEARALYALQRPAQEYLDVLIRALLTFADYEEDKKRHQLAYYELANPMAARVHITPAKEVAIVGGNRSSKTDTCMAELSIRMTGHIPMSLQGTYPRERLRQWAQQLSLAETAAGLRAVALDEELAAAAARA